MLPCDFNANIVCVSEPYTAALELVAMYKVLGRDGQPLGPDESAMARLGVRIRDLRSDNVIEVSTRGMSRKCHGGSCAYYIRTCSDDQLSCRFVVTVAASSDRDFKFVPREFEIVARSVDEFRAAAANIHIGLAGAPNSIAVAELQDQHTRATLSKFSAWSID